MRRLDLPTLMITVLLIGYIAWILYALAHRAPENRLAVYLGPSCGERDRTVLITLRHDPSGHRLGECIEITGSQRQSPEARAAAAKRPPR